MAARFTPRAEFHAPAMRSTSLRRRTTGKLEASHSRTSTAERSAGLASAWKDGNNIHRSVLLPVVDCQTEEEREEGTLE
uniref:Uncharacterized protein n=1 Tax=Pristionchus pacificus TaxID=54126 RepID=A0A2A6CHJ2_PRIPA|eukprot:PDM77695.1 hypothetical protein PRIPAC_34562 [Pristionchus pacificus]